jgi:hypothetical protein
MIRSGLVGTTFAIVHTGIAGFNRFEKLNTAVSATSLRASDKMRGIPGYDRKGTFCLLSAICTNKFKFGYNQVFTDYLLSSLPQGPRA